MARRHYLDHASTVPLRPEATAALNAWLHAPTGDPGRIHHEGMAARVALEDAREQVASFLGARSREVVFTSGATESIVTATWGAADRGAHMVVSAVEHSAVRQAAVAHAARVTEVGVDGTGRVDPHAMLDAIGPDTALVHLQWANHEVGTVQPVAEVVAGCRERGVLVHVDAAQAAGRVPIDFGAIGADLLSVSGHKLGAPAGIGVLVVRRGLRLRSLLVGGDQERARRAGLENLAGALALGAVAGALEPDRIAAEAAADATRAARLAEAATAVAGVRRYGHPEHRLPHLVCIGIADVEPQAVLLGLDRAGIAAHSGSACATESLEPSPVLEAMGVDAHRSLRLSVGWNTTDDDVEAAVTAFPRLVAELRHLRG